MIYGWCHDSDYWDASQIHLTLLATLYVFRAKGFLGATPGTYHPFLKATRHDFTCCGLAYKLIPTVASMHWYHRIYYNVLIEFFQQKQRQMAQVNQRHEAQCALYTHD